MSTRTADVTLSLHLLWEENIKTFYSLIQLDGYNPLGVEKLTYQVAEEKAESLLALHENLLTTEQKTGVL